ncbi:MAG TPA: hypothetical protein VJA47_06445 [archaeon]|nr:hypothetical protein [archaeon]
MVNVLGKEIVNSENGDGFNLNFSKTHKYLLAVFTIATVALFAIQLVPMGLSGFATTSSSNSQPAAGSADINAITEKVVPEAGFKISAKWGDVVKKMVDTGALDPVKLENIITKKYGQEMDPEWKAIMAGKDTNLEINAKNSVFMMYVLWILAKDNDNKILHDSPFADSFGQDYDIGAGKKGYGDLKLLSLTPEQQEIAKKVAENAYRPCCGQSTARPDCSHGFSALGLIQLMASQGFTEKEIFDAFIKFNSFWFPANYIQTALYFKISESKDWEQVDKQLIAGQQFSSVTGAQQVKKALQNAGF